MAPAGTEATNGDEAKNGDEAMNGEREELKKGRGNTKLEPPQNLQGSTTVGNTLVG